jgi:trehalose synthase
MTTAPIETAHRIADPGAAQGSRTPPDPDTVDWLVGESMLEAATRLTRGLSGSGHLWRRPFARPAPREAVRTASVWYSAYPLSLITAPGGSFLGTLADPDLWSAFRRIGVDAVHPGPVKTAGGLTGRTLTPTIDGNFDRIMMRVDSEFGSQEEYQALTSVAADAGAVVIDDVIPGHTGKGADFRLAEMAYDDYPGIFHLIEIDPVDWPLLPEVPLGKDCANLDEATQHALTESGYIVGAMQRVLFKAEGVKETNWSATPLVTGVDGVDRRWVYLHYFKAGQPSINWIDPTFAGPRMVIGDALHSMTVLGARGLRLDANGFLGIEKGPAGSAAWSQGHPLSLVANALIAGTVRKLGGFTFQELNLSMDDIRQTLDGGADLSYDFITRPAYQHALATADTEFLRLTLLEMRRAGIDPASLVHGLQNHDELTYELVHFESAHAGELYAFRGGQVTGAELAALVRRELTEALTGPRAPYNLVFTTNGIACTTASIATAVLGMSDLSALLPADVDAVRSVHLLLAAFNALQPGVFALSGWDLSGALPVAPEAVAALLSDGDTRWIHRGAHDLMGVDPAAPTSAAGMPRARSLYPPLPEQLGDPTSFAVRLGELLTVRKALRLAEARQVDVPLVSHRSVLAMVHELDGGQTQVSLLNFGPDTATAAFGSPALTPGAVARDALTNDVVGKVAEDGTLEIILAGHQAACLVFV